MTYSIYDEGHIACRCLQGVLTVNQSKVRSQIQLPPYDQAQLSVHLPVTYLHLNPGPDKPVLIFFHGYSDTGAAFLRRAFPHLDQRYEILAPNGLFPTPLKEKKEWKQAFAWYFVDPSQQRALIPPSVAAEAVVRLIEQLHLQNRRKVLLGFSQGGFFLPFVYPLLRNVEKLFSIGAAYRPEDYPAEMQVTLDAIHGEDDSIITLQRARDTFESFGVRNLKGEFRSFAGLGHTLNDEARLYLQKKVDEVFK